MVNVVVLLFVKMSLTVGIFHHTFFSSEIEQFAILHSVIQFLRKNFKGKQIWSIMPHAMFISTQVQMRSPFHELDYSRNPFIRIKYYSWHKNVNLAEQNR
jgi:hypothetical protein